jgi:hypothetical protein
VGLRISVDSGLVNPVERNNFIAVQRLHGGSEAACRSEPVVGNEADADRSCCTDSSGGTPEKEVPPAESTISSGVLIERHYSDISMFMSDSVPSS